MEKRFVLVTGGCGYIGSHVVDLLHPAGFTPVVIDNLSTGRESALLHNETLVRSSLEPKVLDEVLHQYAIKSVLHFAASTSVPESTEKPGEYYRNNFQQTLNLMEAVQRNKVEHFIFSSTAAVYGNPQTSDINENHPLVPISPYGKSKLACEWLVKDFAAVSKFRYGVLRYFNVAGAHPGGYLGQRNEKAAHLILSSVRAAIDPSVRLTIYGDDYPTPDGTGVRDYIHVADLAQAHLLVLKALIDGNPSMVLNCGYGQGFSVNEVVQSVQRVSGRTINVHIGSRRPGDISSCVANADRIKASLGWVPHFANLDSIVEHSYKWEMKQREHAAPPEHS